MTRERAKELLPVIEAYANGERIQCRKDSKKYDGWVDMDGEVTSEPHWLPGVDYRIKPKPPLEAWAVVDSNNSIWGFYETKGDAEDVLRDNDNWRAVRMREVEEGK